jgi:hypothetical protein
MHLICKVSLKKISLNIGKSKPAYPPDSPPLSGNPGQYLFAEIAKRPPPFSR